MIQVIIPETSYLEKPWNSILNKSNIKVWNWKKKLTAQKELKNND